MNRNIRIAKQLVVLAKELMAEKSMKAYFPAPWAMKGARFDLQPNWKKVETYDELLETCSDVDFDKTSNCLLNSSMQAKGSGKKLFDIYGAPFYVYKDGNKSIAMMHEDSKQIKSIMTDIEPSDEGIKRSALGVIMLNYFQSTRGDNSYDLDEIKKLCSSGNFKSLLPYLDEIQQQWNDFINGKRSI